MRLAALHGNKSVRVLHRREPWWRVLHAPHTERQLLSFASHTKIFLPWTSANMITSKDTQLALIHIPLHLYRNFLQSILQLVLPNATRKAFGNGSGAVQPPKGWPCEHPFVNISITPVECSIVCSRTLASELFVPVLNLLDAESKESVSITTDDFVVMQVDGEGLDAGQRVLELTSPLALAGM